MWCVENRGRYERHGLRYPTDLTDAEWALVSPHIRAA
ncbi:MAG: IS5/IS1182 family transposase, partial [Pseudomonadota bacterium]|nr:IS5/IS1182 family transposase [Pseudomonadota bacterium]